MQNLFLAFGILTSVCFHNDDPPKTSSPALPKAPNKAGPAFEARFKDALLRDGKRELKVRRVVAPANDLSPIVGDARIIIANGTVVRVRAISGEKQWSSNLPKGLDLMVWLTVTDRIAYGVGYQGDRDSGPMRPETPLCLHQLDVANGRWLATLPIAEPDKQDHKSDIGHLLAALPTPKGVTVLSAVVRGNRMERYLVQHFRVGETRPVWRKDFRATPEAPSPSAVLLWAARRPTSAGSAIQHLVAFGEQVVVCAGPTQDLIGLDFADGKQVWRISRIWQYERGFIGPSVWAHTLGPTDSKAGTGFLVGGPIVVPGREAGSAKKGVPWDEDHGPRMFVAVAHSRDRDYAEYTADCVVYEFAKWYDRFNAVSRVTLPRAVLGKQYAVRDRALVWACQHNSMVRLLSSTRIGFLMGPGGPDFVGQVEWYREPKVTRPDAWLVTEKAGEPVAFGPAHAVRPLAGGFVEAEVSSVFHLPLALIDYQTGLDRTITIDVPFTGRVPAPESNYERSQLLDGRFGYRTMGPYGLMISRLEFEDTCLWVTLEASHGSADLCFDLRGVLFK